MKQRMTIIVLTILSVLSCSKNDDLSNLKETIFVRHKNADMPAYIFGNGTEKVFLITLHGGPGGLGLSFRGDAFDSIEEAYAVVYFDQRGSGMSQGNYSEDDINIDIMAEDVLALVKVLKHKYGNDSRFFLLGHSWGGTLGTATVLKDQNEFLGWIQVDGTHNQRDLYAMYLDNFTQVATEQIGMGNSISFWESVNSLVANAAPTYNLDDYTDLNFKATDAEEVLANDNVIDEEGGIHETFFQYNQLTAYWNLVNIQSLLGQDIRGILSYTSRLPEIEIPTLILWGRFDMVIPPSFANEAYDNIGSVNKELIFFERSGHVPYLSEADSFAEKVLQFMDQNKQ